MDKVVDGVDKFLNYGPLGFSALIFVIVVIALLAGRSNENRDRMLRLIIWAGLFVYCVAAALAFVSEYTDSRQKVISAALGTELNQAAQQAQAAIGRIKTIPGMVSGSCSGGESGVNPKNFNKVVATANDAAESMVVVYGSLRSALAYAPPSAEPIN
ncbi:hypothetical protein [Rhizobium phaseoli]|uniref:hypothetical protein n=1 Tax=Rhizobium phaseoli TaxID=396 RepID=UPI000369D177|nr:hypothetical protein [Rhizobium phaseoli]KKZ89051.1 hypothetical protein RPHASCH2410_CH00210 [Rhizobium phaseoli Ch24-10]